MQKDKISLDKEKLKNAEKITPIPYIEVRTIDITPSNIAFIFKIVLSFVSPLFIEPKITIAPTQ